VLAVDDELPILRFLRASLTEAGFRVVEATNGRTALGLAVSKKPDVILLDLGRTSCTAKGKTRELWLLLQ
jgi:two-component system KDP operon response regulator KdpE